MLGLPAPGIAHAAKERDVLHTLPPGAVRIEGHLGQKLELSRRNRVMSQNLDLILKPFRERTEKDYAGFSCEYWGKWFTSAALAHAHVPSTESRALLDRAIDGLLATQSADGYIGSYATLVQLGGWDAWCRKYVLHGLLAYHELFGDERVLTAAQRFADYLIAQLDAGKIDLGETGYPDWRGLPATSILEPVALLYQRTGQRKYRDLAERLVASWSRTNQLSPKQGLRLVEDATRRVPPAQIGIPKAYEMMSNYEGLCELYRGTGERKHLTAALRLAEGVRDHERMIVGSGSNQELWNEGVRVQTELLEQPLETCVTVTWMKLAYQMLRLTGDSRWGDELERSLYNALLGSMTPDGEWWSYYCPLAGQRTPSHMQHIDVGLSCCVTSGPRGLFLTPRWAVMAAHAGPVVNLYAPGKATVPLTGGNTVELEQETDYPRTDTSIIKVTPQKRASFTVSLRIPAWSAQTEIRVNGRPVKSRPGSYARIRRQWSVGDRVELSFDMRGRVIPAPSDTPQIAIVRGPVVLTLDNRFAPPQNVAARLAGGTDAGFVDLVPVEKTPAGAWMAFTVPFVVQRSHAEFEKLPLTMVDFASAGNQWSPDNLYRVWLPQPLSLHNAYPKDTWRLSYPTFRNRPAIPGK